MDLNLSHFSVVLCSTKEAGNLGSVCRAMKNMGLKNLILVNCQEMQIEDVKLMAVHALDIYENALRYTDLFEALRNFNLALGFTRRRGGDRKKFFYNIKEAFAFIKKKPFQKVALVFGNERAGLTNTELECCSLAVNIPSSDNFPSLNLAQAVQIACYEVRTNFLNQVIDNKPEEMRIVSKGEVENSVTKIIAYLREIGFFKITKHNKLEIYLKNLLERAALCKTELSYFEKIFNKATGMLRDKK